MKRAPKQEEQYLEYHSMLGSLLDDLPLPRDLEHVLLMVSRSANLLALEVAILQPVSREEGLANTDPRISAPYRNLLALLKALREICASIDGEFAAIMPPGEHQLDGDYLFDGAVLCGRQARLIAQLLRSIRGERQDAPPRTFVYSIMVRFGKRLGLGYDVQARLLAPRMTRAYETLSDDAQARKRRTVEKELKEAFKREVEVDIEVLMKGLPEVHTVRKQLLNELIAPLDWILRCCPPE